MRIKSLMMLPVLAVVSIAPAQAYNTPTFDIAMKQNGKCAQTKTTRLSQMPTVAAQATQFDMVAEYTGSGDAVLNRWYTPVNSSVSAIAGQDLVMDRGANKYVSITVNGVLGHAVAPVHSAAKVDCPDSIQQVLDVKSMQCSVVLDNVNLQPRYLARVSGCS